MSLGQKNAIRGPVDGDMTGCSYSAFGLMLASDQALPIAPVSHGASNVPMVTILHRDIAEVAGYLSLPPTLVWQTSFDGIAYRTDRGADGDCQFAWGERAVFHLAADGATLSCGLCDQGDLAARRLFLDTVLWSVSLIHGYELLHASAVRLDGGAVAFVAGTGAGKTSIAAELVSRGAELLTDDVLALGYGDGARRVVAHPGPSVMNLPLTVDGQLRYPDLGTTVATFGPEAWTRVRSAVEEPQCLSAVCLLERTDEPTNRLEPHPQAPLALLPHALGFPGSRHRLGRQFEVMSDLVAQVPVMRLVAGRASSPAQLANLVETDVGASATPDGVL